MRIAIIGPGGMGGGIGRLLARAGHKVIFSGSRSPEKLAHAAELAGPNARTASVPDAAAEADVVVVAVPFDRYPEVAREAGEALPGKLVIDTSNPITVRDERVEFLDVPGGLTAAQYQQLTLGEGRLVKAVKGRRLRCLHRRSLGALAGVPRSTTAGRGPGSCSSVTGTKVKRWSYAGLPVLRLVD